MTRTPRHGTPDPRSSPEPDPVEAPGLPDELAAELDAEAIDLAYLSGDEPSAVLLVELSTRTVVHADAVAQQLAPDVSLPCSLDAWSDAAELRDPLGGLLSETDHPLSRLSRAEPVAGQGVSARRDSDMGERRQPLWVIAIPLIDAPGLKDYGLVVMLPVRLRAAAEAASRMGVPRWGLDLHSRAALATGLSFTLADATDPELPLVWVNPAFTATTGYTLDDALGHNCRFLQGPGTDPERVAEIRRALEAGVPVTTTLLNYRKDGTPYWNQLNVSPVRGADDQLTHFVGIQSDVSDRIEADRARDAALDAERHARAAAQDAEGRLQLMADASIALSSASDTDDAYRRLSDLLVPRVADFVLVLGTTSTETLDVRAIEHVDPSRLPALRELAESLASALVPGPPLEVLLGPTGARLLRDLSTESGNQTRLAFIADPEYFRASSAFPVESAILVAFPGRRETTEVLVLGRGAGRSQFDTADVDAVADLGRRAGLLVENVRLYDLQRTNSEILQRSLLPALPYIKGIRSAARYHAGAVGSQVGGDFYDLTTLDDGTVALAVGDVVGHDILAAAAMGQLKGLLRACVHDDGTTPSRVLERVDKLLDDLDIRTLASGLQAFLTPTDDGWQVTWSTAGHPPLAIRHPNGHTTLLGDLGEHADPLLGVAPGRRRDTSAVIPPGSLVLGYTDGLVERRHESLDLGLHRLLHQVEVGPHEPVALIEHLVEQLGRGSDHDDDIALVALLLG